MTINIISEVQLLLNMCDLQYRARHFITQMLLYGLLVGIGVGLIFYDPGAVEISVGIGLVVFIVFEAGTYAILLLISNKRAAMIEGSLPDFLSIMASNVRSGLTPDRALLLSARKEFGPLAREIDRAAKETIVGKPITDALMGMTGRIRSEMFSKTMRLIVEGINSGGNTADLLENTALDIRRFGAIRKEVAATVLVYQLFMFAAVAFGAPLLYSVTTFLIKVISQTRERIGVDITAEAASSLSFFSSSTIISPELVFIFSLAAIGITTFFGSLTAGVISKGKESEGLPYLPILLLVALGLFFLTRFFLETVFSELFFV